jgi:hypothetical protein
VPLPITRSIEKDIPVFVLGGGGRNVKIEVREYRLSMDVRVHCECREGLSRHPSLDPRFERARIRFSVG